MNTHSTGMPVSPAPIALEKRISTLDLLRGVALLGILMLNIDNFVGPESEAMHDIPVGLAKAAFVGWHASLDYIIFAIKWTLFEGKMRGLFAVLFGASTVLLLQRLESRSGEGRASDIFHRRSMWLLLFGVLHGILIWAGDILTYYALVALLFLYPLRNVNGRKLLFVGMAIWIVGGTFGTFNAYNIPKVLRDDAFLHSALDAQSHGNVLSPSQKAAIVESSATHSNTSKDVAEQMDAGRKGFVESFPINLDSYEGFFSFLINSWLILELVGAVIAGMGLFKLGFLSNRMSTRQYMTIAALGYLVVLPLGLGGVWYAALHDFSMVSCIKSLYVPYTILQVSAVLANASLVILIYRSGWFKPIIGSLTAVGRMAITNYLMTSLLCRFIFSWGPWKLYGTLEFYQYMYVVGGVWLANLVFSSIWLRHFAFGPIEWVWRSLTYWKLQPIRLGELS